MIKQSIRTCLLVLCAACSSNDAVDIGDGRVGQRLSDYAAVWEGYAEAHQFADGSDRVRIVLDDEGSGTLVVGEAASPDTTGSTLPVDPYAFREPVPGFAYPIRSALVEASRLRLDVDLKELYRPWCEEQTATLYSELLPGAYACLPNGTNVTEQGECSTLEGRVFPCEAVTVCYQTCECTASACTIGDHPPQWHEAASQGFDLPVVRRTRVDGALTNDGDSLEGTLATDGSGPRIRLTRQ